MQFLRMSDREPLLGQVQPVQHSEPHRWIDWMPCAVNRSVFRETQDTISYGHSSWLTRSCNACNTSAVLPTPPGPITVKTGPRREELRFMSILPRLCCSRRRPISPVSSKSPNGRLLSVPFRKDGVGSEGAQVASARRRSRVSLSVGPSKPWLSSWTRICCAVSKSSTSRGPSMHNAIPDRYELS